MDARLESANRASLLHKKRTGKDFLITKDIVEKEAMYEEIDERYQEKRIKMLQAQNLQIEEEFHRHLLKAFAKRANYPNGSSIASRRASNMTPLHPVGGSRKMSLDLSNLRSSSFSKEPGLMASPMSTSDGYVLSPAASYDPNMQSSMTCMNGPESPYANMIPATATTPAKLPAYVQPTWQHPSATMPQTSTPDQIPTDTHVQMWQQQITQHIPKTVQMRQFSERLVSAPECTLQTPLSPSLTPPSHGHSRGQSQPSSSFQNLQLLTQSHHLHAPKVGALPAETHSTPGLCLTPHTSVSPITASVQTKTEADAMLSGQMYSIADSSQLR